MLKRLTVTPAIALLIGACGPPPPPPPPPPPRSSSLASLVPAAAVAAQAWGVSLKRQGV